MTKLPQKRRLGFRRRAASGSAVTKPVDRWLVASLIGFSMLCAAFPWYVFFNQDKFGVNVAGWEGLRNIRQIRPAGDGGIGAMRDPLLEESEQALGSQIETDRLTTATVPSTQSGNNIAAPAFEDQPFPGGKEFRLLHVANGRALIENGSGIFLVQIGSKLPDNSRLASLRLRSGKWEIVTSAGMIYSE
jgi:hypothetical protein